MLTDIILIILFYLSAEMSVFLPAFKGRIVSASTNWYA